MRFSFSSFGLVLFISYCSKLFFHIFPVSHVSDKVAMMYSLLRFFVSGSLAFVCYSILFY